ncbi:MAG TPA: hypothetical protein VGN18_00365 [Jatrophihabitans sp.]|jgi:hypothetical protein|uniref:hypothetical protein n=1 Tax=Jatrophihabitans sp. TaxID=1932789 RepID=UPI002E09610E|nr:hypothetical protein [Jatrophihabitans sp.]
MGAGGEATPAGAIELRVHGVSGTPPEDLLDRPLVHQIGGNAIAGFYVPRRPAERPDAAPDVCAPTRPTAASLVGYSWGGLTSGSPARALWLALLPFTLLNVAPRSRPPGAPAKGFCTWLIWYLCRLISLTLTVLFVLVGVGVGEDLIGWQCVGGRSCTKAAPGWIFNGLSAAHHLKPETMLLIGAAVPTLLLTLIWYTSTRTANRYERTIADVGGAVTETDLNDEPDVDDIEVPLESQLMWRNANQVRRLRAIHMQSGYAVVLLTVIATTRYAWVAVVPAAILTYAVIVLGVNSYTGHRASSRWHLASRAIWILLAATGIAEILGLLVADTWIDGRFLGAGAERLPLGGLPYYAPTILATCAVALGLLLGLGVPVGLAARGATPAPPPPHQPLAPGLFGLGTWVFAALGVLLAATFGAGAYIFAATWLHTGSVKPGFADVSATHRYFVLPAAVATASVAYTIAVFFVLLLVLVLAVVAGSRYARQPGHAGALSLDYAVPTGPDPLGENRRRAVSIRRDMFLGSLVDKAPLLIGPLVLFGLAIVIFFGGILLSTGGQAPVVLFGHGTGWRSPAGLGGIGAYLAVSTLLGIVSLGALAFRVPATRRSVGILWDVASFWPRASHPLAAPCYAERTVPDLVTFLTDQHLRSKDAPIVLSAHSQGTVISAATLRQLRTFDQLAAAETGVIDHLGFLTFGCVLRRLYGRYFPVYFGPAELAEVQAILTAPSGAGPRWRNLWRYTDYLGGQVTAGPGPQLPTTSTAPVQPDDLIAAPPVTGPAAWEWHSPDPPLFDRAPGDTTYSSPGRHSDFWKDRSGYFQLAVADLVEHVRTDTGT